MITIDRKALSAALALIKPAIIGAQRSLPSYNLPTNVRMHAASGRLEMSVLGPKEKTDYFPSASVSLPASGDLDVTVDSKFVAAAKSLIDKSKHALKVSLSAVDGDPPVMEYLAGIVKSSKRAQYTGEMLEEIDWVIGLPLMKGNPYQVGYIGSAKKLTKEQAKTFVKDAKAKGQQPKVQPPINAPEPLTPSTVTLKVNGTQLETLGSVDKGKYSALPTSGGFEVPARDLKAMLDPISANMSSDTTRAHLSASLFSIGDHGLRMVGTDGHRLLAATLDTKVKGEAELVVPGMLVHFFTKAVSKAKGVAKFYVKDNVLSATVDVGEVTAGIRAPDLGLTFPAYEQVIPNKQDSLVTMTLDVQGTIPLVKLIANMRAIVSDRMQGIQIGLTDEGAPAVGMTGGERDEYNPSVLLPGTAKTHGKPQVIGLNAPYLVDALEGFEDEVTVHLREELDPIVLFGRVGNIEFDSVVMPMRLSMPGARGSHDDAERIVVRRATNTGSDPRSAGDLLAMAKYADYFAAKKATMPMLESTLVTCGDGKLSMAATDLYNTGITTVMDHGPKFAVAVPSKDLERVLWAFPTDARLSLDWDDHEKHPGLFIRDMSTGMQMGLSGLPAKEFPPIPAAKGQIAGTVSSNALVPLVQGVQATASRDWTRAHLNGVAWRLKGSSWSAITTDGHRATWGTITVPDSSETSRNIMSLDAFLGIPKMLDRLTGKVRDIQFKVGHQKNSEFILPDTGDGVERRLIYKMVEAQSPAFEQLFDKGGFVSSVTVDRKRLQAAATLVDAAEKSVDTGKTGKTMVIEASGGKLMLKGLHAKAKTVVPFESDGAEPDLALNPEYVAQLCKASSDETLTLYDPRQLGPVRCWFTNGPYVHLDWLGMPIRTEHGADVAGSVAKPKIPAPPAAPLGARETRPAHARKARKLLKITDANAFEKLTKLEGQDWAKRERKHQAEPNTFFDSLEGFKILIDEGLVGKSRKDPETGEVRPVLIGDITGSDGFIGANDEIYIVDEHGHVVLFADTASDSKAAKAEKILRVLRAPKRSRRKSSTRGSKRR